MNVKTIDAGELNAYDVLDCDWMLFTDETLPTAKEKQLMRDAMSVLIRPVVSEKTYASMDKGTYVFVVDPRATKVDVRNAVEQTFNVKVTNVNTLNRKGKSTRNRRTGVAGIKPDTKRAIVTLRAGDTINLFEN